MNDLLAYASRETLYKLTFMTTNAILRHLCLLVISAYSVGQLSAADLFDKQNLAAWCIVPFDAAKRGPEARAEMVAKMGIKKIAYDWRQEHVAEFEREIIAYQKHGIEFFAFWGAHDEAFRLFEKYQLHPQLWIMMKGTGETQEAQVKSAAEGLLPILAKAKAIGSQVGIYNHGGWGGEPENMVAVCEYLKMNHATDNIGIIYNLHHGHSHLDLLPKAIEAMKPHLLCLNLNGMDIAGDTKGRKILPLGVGTQDVKVLRQIRASGYNGPIGILNHTDEDAERRLLDNLDGLKWLVPQLDDEKPGEKPQYRTWDESKQKPVSKSSVSSSKPESVASLNAEFGTALKGGWVVDGDPEYSKLPFTVECRAKLDGKKDYNILVASEMKSSATHWELYTHAGRGTLALFMPGRGGDFDSKVDVCDGKWHDFIASVDEKSVVLWIDGKQVFEKPVQALKGTPKPGGLTFCRLVEGNIGCDGIIDDVRLSRGVMKPRKGNAPRMRMDNTLGLWDFDNLRALLPPPAPKAAEFKPELPPLDKTNNIHWQEFVNRERVFDFYGKQALLFMKQKPLPALIPPFPGMDGGQQGHWGNQNDQTTWKDGRWAASDLGNVFTGVFKGAGLTIPKALCVRIGDKAAVFDPARMAWRLEWSGGFIKLNDNRHGFMAGAPMNGQMISKKEKKLPGSYRGFFRRVNEVTIVTTETPLPDPGPAQWPRWIETKGELGTQTPFATDRLTIPFENPYGTLFFITAHDFFSDGTAAIATMTGEVWLVKGIDEKLENLRWKRFATGLHQPLGMKIVKDKLYVLGRDQITCLHDLNNDDEADFYECVTNAMQTSPGGHDFIVGLEADKEVHFYFASGNQGVCKVGQASSLLASANLEILATGFRNPNGLGLSPDGRFITTSGQEGDWTPASSIFQIELGKNEGAHFGAGGPKNGQPPEPVLMYLPRGEDNSSSSQAFISSDKWASLKGDGNLIHLSSGGGSAWLMMRQNVKGLWQGAAVKISGNFDSGPQCARFNPKDGHLYVNGMTGWGTYTPKDGCFQRVRFTGGDKPVPVGFEARDNGVLVRFNQPVKDANAATCFAQCWNYKYGPQYGSPEYSVKYPDTPGHDPLEIRSLQILDAGRTLFLEIPQLTPASQIHLHLPTGHDLFLTAHALAEPYTDFPTYTRIAKTSHAAQTTVTAPTPSKPNPWAQDHGGRKLTIEAALGLQYVQKQLSAKPGEKLSITFSNPDVVPHNWLLAKPGSLEKLGALCNLMITDPNGLAKHYVPDSPDVLFYTDMTNPNASSTIHFTAPNQPGTYPYLCTFPGHWMIMNGQLKVE